MRRIVHLDMDAFYASVEQRDDARLRGTPFAVGGRPESRGVVAAASYEARASGVRSAMPMARAVRLCPDLVIVPPDFERYRRVSTQVMDLLRACTPMVEPLSLDEAYLDVTENSWDEPLASVVARSLKQQIRDTTGLTASAGVAPNKFLAKIASGYRKPDGLTVIPPGRVEAFLQELPVEALWGVGPVTARKLKNIGLKRLVQVRTVDMDLLRQTVGSLADWLRQLSHGDDPRPVVADRESKSSSTENTYVEDLLDLEAIRAELDRMARENADWLAKRRLTARTVTIKVRYANFKTVTRSHTLSLPTNDADLISSWAKDLAERTDAGRIPVRLLGVRVQGLVAHLVEKSPG
jgi:DNA polymerase IV